MRDLLVLWDVDYTLLSASGLGNRLYAAVFKDMFGRDLTTVAPKAGRTDRAIAGDTLALAGVPRAQAVGAHQGVVHVPQHEQVSHPPRLRQAKAGGGSSSPLRMSAGGTRLSSRRVRHAGRGGG